jgi:hypothetical protein
MKRMEILINLLKQPSDAKKKKTRYVCSIDPKKSHVEVPAQSHFYFEVAITQMFRVIQETI